MSGSTARRSVLAALVFLIGLGVTVVVVDNGPDHPGKPRRTVTVTLGGPGHDKVVLPPEGQQIVQAQAREDAKGDDVAAESDLHEDKLPPPAVMRKAENMRPAGQPTIPAHVPLAAASEPGCRTALVRNFSSRKGAPVLFFFLHWTGSRSIAFSWTDVNAIDAWFDRLVSQASSNFITDDDGHCILAVPVSQKSWTQANSNPWAVSDEHVNPGAGPLFTNPAGRRIVLRLMISMHHAFKLPYRHGIVKQGRNGTCIPVRSGYLSHRDGGPCSGGHPDVGNFNLDGLIAEAKRADGRSPARIRADHAAVHRRLGARNCSLSRPRSHTCKHLVAVNHRVHAEARARHLTL